MNVMLRVAFAGMGEPYVARCLGRFRLEDSGGNPLQIRNRKSRALLATLALSRRGWSRDALADLLWSDRGPAQAKGSLRQSIFELHHLGGDVQLLAVGREELAVHGELFVTDLQLIEAAASRGEWGPLLELLRQSEPGLLTDLDGLDAEFDDWVRSERTREPARTLAAVLAASDRCIGEEGPRVAADILAELLRLDPDNEECVRAALRADHSLGDSIALRRRYAALRRRLRDEYGAGPSSETAELFKALSSGSTPTGTRPRRAKEANQAKVSRRKFAQRGWWSAAAALAVLIVALGLTQVFKHSAAPRSANAPILVAILPFEQSAPGDHYLAEGLWDDTRSAVSRNASLRVLGRATIIAGEQRKLSPAQYRGRFGVAYLLDGAIRRRGDEVEIAVSLTRTSDGVAIWEDRFVSRVGDPRALPLAIANTIEGKLRGRLAPGGGRLPDQITTAPAVYALYSEARSLIHDRNRMATSRARALLQKAVERDPNFAPAWSSLAAATYFGASSPAGAAEKNREALDAARRAIALAPNLAEAHATLALIEGDNSPLSEAPLRKALALDPSYVEAWNWLGNSLASQSRYREAIGAYQRAVDLDPLWPVPAQNLVSVARDYGDRTAIRDVVAKLAASGAERELIDTIKAEDRLLAGDYSTAVKLLAAGASGDDRQASAARLDVWVDVLTRLGYPEAATRRVGAPFWYGPVVKSERLPPTVMDGKVVTPADFWETPCLPNMGGRAMFNLGRSRELLRLYHARFRIADDFIATRRPPIRLINEAPTLAMALMSSGLRGEADYILGAAFRMAETEVRLVPQSAERTAALAYVRAAQGQRDQALHLLAQALARGWHPDGRLYAIDLAQEPAFARLRTDRRFRTLRQRVLDHIARERAELGPLEF
jgi:DNA-binding SARP family transcriptional activator/TolB-like protein/Tfp pilus assembly protein PilF